MTDFPDLKLKALVNLPGSSGPPGPPGPPGPSAARDEGNVYYAVDYGVVADGTTNNAVVLQACFSAAALTGGAVILPAGVIISNARIIVTLAPSIGLSVVGHGSDITELRWPNVNGGLKITFTNKGNAVHVSSITFTTGQAGGGSGLELVQTDYLGAFPQSTVYDISFRGDFNNGVINAHYWTDAIICDGVSGVAFDAVNIWGSGNQGKGIHLKAPSFPDGTLGHKITNSWFATLQYGIYSTGFEQNLFVSNCSMEIIDYGFWTSSGGDVYFIGNTLHAYVEGFHSEGASLSGIITGCYFEIVGTRGIYISDMTSPRIIGNSFGDPRGITAGTVAIDVVGGVSGGSIVGNHIENCSAGIKLAAATSFNELKANTYKTNTSNIVDSGASNLLDTQFNNTIALKGSIQTGLDFTGTTSMVDAVRFPNNTQMQWKDSGGTLRPIISVGSSLIVGDMSMNTFFNTGNMLPISDNFISIGAAAPFRFASVNSVLSVIHGSSSGVITMKGQAAAGTYNFNMPVTAGSAGQVLASAAGGAAPMTWARNEWQLLNTLTASNSALLSDTTSISAAYDDYVLVFDNIVPVTNAVEFILQVQSGGVFQTTGYLNSGALTTGISLTNTNNLGNTAGFGMSGQLFICNLNSTTTVKMISGRPGHYTGAAMATPNIAGAWTAGMGVITGMQFLMSSGNISTGKIKIYGLRA